MDEIRFLTLGAVIQEVVSVEEKRSKDSVLLQFGAQSLGRWEELAKQKKGQSSQ